LRELLGADQRYTSQIAEIIRRDPSLTARLLRLVNSVYYGMAKPVKNIEEAVFYLGVRQIRQLAMVTPIIEDFQRLAEGRRFPWRQFWRHCIAVALMTREITDLMQSQDDEIDYVAGLIHDVGKIVMASAFPDHFTEIYNNRAQMTGDLLQWEKEVLGVDHAELGAMYLRKQRLPEVFVEIVQCHHIPQQARLQSGVTAAVHVADLLVRHTKIGDSGNKTEVPLRVGLNRPVGRFYSAIRTTPKNPSPAPASTAAWNASPPFWKAWSKTASPDFFWLPTALTTPVVKGSFILDMAAANVDTKSLAELVQPEILANKGFPVPNRVSVICGADHTGEEAYYVYLVFADTTPDADLSWGNVKRMVRWVQDRVWKASGEQRWPYVRVKRESDLSATPS
jgi:putative nucleotidyltransferase with HDIG domain